MQQQPTLALKQIQVSVNPRKFFDAAEMEELTASVREKGVIQPVIVRTLADGGFSLVAGGRRYKAALAAHGEDYEIPVVGVNACQMLCQGLSASPNDRSTPRVEPAHASRWNHP
jgi:ParB/RepB/Spo0J family partition protein